MLLEIKLHTVPHSKDFKYGEDIACGQGHGKTFRVIYLFQNNLILFKIQIISRSVEYLLEPV